MGRAHLKAISCEVQVVAVVTANPVQHTCPAGLGDFRNCVNACRNRISVVVDPGILCMLSHTAQPEFLDRFLRETPMGAVSPAESGGASCRWSQMNVARQMFG